MNNSSPLKDARLKIELDTDDAQAKLDALEERMEEVTGDIQEGDGKLNAQQKKIDKAGKGGSPVAQRGQGKFGVRNTPPISTARGMAESADIGGEVLTGGMLAAAIAYAIKKFLDEGAAFTEGAANSLLNDLPVSAATKSSIRNSSISYGLAALRKTVRDLEARVSAGMPALQQTIEMVKAQVLTGGHVNAEQMKKFFFNSYEWNFAHARKETDIKDKTLKLLGEQAPGVIKDLFMQASKGSVSP